MPLEQTPTLKVQLVVELIPGDGGPSEVHPRPTTATTIHSDGVISSHAQYDLRQAEAKSEAVSINGDVTGWACVKFVYHVILQDDFYELWMAWFLDLVEEKNVY